MTTTPDDFQKKVAKPVAHLAEQLAGIRPGTVSIGFVETFRYDGRALSESAAVTQVKDRIHVIPFDRTKVASIAKALEANKLGAYALNPTTICVPVPPLSGEQKEAMAKHIKKLGEETKVAIRSIRQAARKEQKDDKAGEKAIQKAVDDAVSQTDAMVAAKIKAL